MIRFHALRRIACMIGLLTLATLLVGVGTTSASQVGGLRDPIVRLSNGVVVNMDVASDVQSANVKVITYTLHVPKGIKVESVLYVGPDASKERVRVIADNQPNTYDSYTELDTLSGTARLQDMLTVKVSSAKKFTTSARGFSGNVVRLDIVA